MIAGLLYVLDFESMVQYRQGQPHKKRNIKREIRSEVIDCKGIAGLPDKDNSTNAIAAPVCSDDAKDIEPSSSGSLTYDEKRLITVQKLNQLQKRTVDSENATRVR